MKNLKLKCQRGLREKEDKKGGKITVFFRQNLTNGNKWNILIHVNMQNIITKNLNIKGDKMKDNKKTLIIAGIIMLLLIIGIGLNSQDGATTKEKNMGKVNDILQNVTKNNEVSNKIENEAIENELVTTNTIINEVIKENSLATTTNNIDENPSVTTSSSKTNSNNSSKSSSSKTSTSSNKSSSTQVNSNKKVESNSSTTTNSKTNPNASVTTNKNDSMTVYITPTGKRYHYSPTCGGENSKPTTKADAIARGLTPCKKCAN